MAHVKQHNFRVEAHAIGDRAALHLIDAFEKLFVCDDRPVLTHCQPLGYQKEAEKGPLGTVEPMFSWKESCLTPTFNRKYHIIHPK